MLKKWICNRQVKSGGLYLFGNLFNKAIAFVTVPIFSRIMSTSEYGIVSTYAAWESIFAVIVGLSLGNSIRNAFVDFHDELNTYMSSVFSLSFIVFIPIAFFILFVNEKLGILNKNLLVMCLIQAFSSYLINAMIVKYMMEEKAVKRTLLMILPGFCSAVLSVFLIFNMEHHKEYGRIIPQCVVFAAIGFFLFLLVLMCGKVIVNLVYWKYALATSLPFILQGLSVNILSVSDRTLLAAMRSTSEVGIYSVVYNFGMLALVLTSSMESVWIPFFTKQIDRNGVEKINNYAKVYVEFCTVAFCALLIISPEALIIFASEKYRAGIYLIAPIILASYFQFLYSFAANTEIYYKRFRIIALNTMLSAALNLILNCIFVPIAGGIAAAITTVASYIVSFVIHYRYCKKLNGKLFPVKSFAVSGLAIIFFVIFQYVFMSHWKLRWILGFAGLGILSVYFLEKNKNIF